MSNIDIYNNDRGSVVIETESREQNEIAFAGADKLLEGTILARHTGTGLFIPYVKGGSSNGNGVPKAILTYELEATGAGNVPAQVLTAGIVNESRLVIHADGDNENVDAVVLDLLRAVSIRTKSVRQLAQVDNPQPDDLDS